MSNEAPQYEAILSSVESIKPDTKPFYLSRTFWVNVLMVLSMLFPAVQAWAKANPEALPIIIAFVNLVLRTVTSKAISISGGKSDSENGGASGGRSGGSALPLAFALLCAALFLPSCSSDYPVTGSISYRDAASGAKGGLVFTQGAPPRASVRIPIYDKETGELVGVGELSGSLAGAVEPSK